MRTDADFVGRELASRLADGRGLLDAISTVEVPCHRLLDSYPAWHPAPYDFEGMLRLFLYHKITGMSYRQLERYPELAAAVGLDKTPAESVLSRTWRNRFDDSVQEFITTAAHYVVKEVHDEDMSAPGVRPKAEVLPSGAGPTTLHDEEGGDTSDDGFTEREIHRTTRLARIHGFDGFDSGRTENATYDDTCFFELQTFMGMVGCGTAQDATRFHYRRGPEYGPHGDTPLRTVKQFEPSKLLDGFDVATERLLSVIAADASFRRPVTEAIDITTVPYYGEVDGMAMVSGTKDGEGRAFKFATLSIVGQNIPLVLAVEPVRERSAWDENPPNQIHRVVRRLVRRATEHVPIETTAGAAIPYRDIRFIRRRSTVIASRSTRHVVPEFDGSSGKPDTAERVTRT